MNNLTPKEKMEITCRILEKRKARKEREQKKIEDQYTQTLVDSIARCKKWSK